MKKKIVIAFILINFLGLGGCFEHCKDYEFYDYKGIKIVVQNPNVLMDDSLSFGIELLNTQYLSKVKYFSGNKLFAAIDCDKGFGGDKYPLIRISIKSDSDFNENYPANSELNDLISIRGTNFKGESVLGKVSDFLPSNLNIGYMYLSTKPTNLNEHKITIEIEKSNGEVLSATSESITWDL